MKPLFALIDCNNFFVSCERVFRPDLDGKPVVVLSSNDGCAVARSNEAKALGIPMGAPAFKYRQLFKEQGVVQFSANFELYGDMSDRITRILTTLVPRLEVYSVDEAFLDLSQLTITDYQEWGKRIRTRLLQDVGIPVSIGIAASKTLAKLASEQAKKVTELEGVLDLFTMPPEAVQEYLRQTPIHDIWGIGRRLAPTLRAEGIYTGLDLAHMRSQLASQLMGVHGRQLIAEMNGISCHPLEPAHHVRQSVMHGRMFGEDTNEFSVIVSAIASLTARASFRLRNDGLLAHSAVLSLSTNRHKPGYQRLRQYVELTTPTADTGIITAQLVASLQHVYNSRQSYHRADVILYDLSGDRMLQTDLFGDVDILASNRSQARMEALDAINERYGRRSLHFAAEDISQAWEPKRKLRSPRYTTDWQELPRARII